MASQAAVANSASFQQDSVLVARYAADRRARGFSVSSHASEASISEEETAYSSVCGSGVATPVPRHGQTTTTEPPSTKSQKYLHHDAVSSLNETSPLLPRPTTTERNSHARGGDDDLEGEWTWWDELKTLTSYVLPVYGYVLLPLVPLLSLNILTRLRERTHLLEYSLNIASVISIGHISTVALAACSLGNMTAGVTGFSIVQGFASALDTLLPSAWTSGNPQLVGLWLQRMLLLVTLLTFVSCLLFCTII